jgi:Ni,Fe-hydrogenase maturation factor
VPDLGHHVWSSSGLPEASGKQECGHLVEDEAGYFMLFPIFTFRDDRFHILFLDTAAMQQEKGTLHVFQQVKKVK